MTRTDERRLPVRRSAQEVALRELYVALRGAHDALRHAHHLVTPFALARPSGLRSGLTLSTRVDAELKRAYGWNDRDQAPPHSLNPWVPIAQQEVMELRADVRAHLVAIQLLKEENRQLCQEVARLLGQRRVQGPPPCS